MLPSPEAPTKSTNKQNQTVFDCKYCDFSAFNALRAVKHQQKCLKNPTVIVKNAFQGYHHTGSEVFDCLLCDHSCTTEARITSHIRCQHRSSIDSERDFGYRVTQTGLNIIFTRELIKNRDIFKNVETLNTNYKLFEGKMNKLEEFLKDTLEKFEKNFVGREEFNTLSGTVQHHSTEITNLLTRMDKTEQNVVELQDSNLRSETNGRKMDNLQFAKTEKEMVELQVATKNGTTVKNGADNVAGSEMVEMDDLTGGRSYTGINSPSENRLNGRANAKKPDGHYNSTVGNVNKAASSSTGCANRKMSYLKYFSIGKQYIRYTEIYKQGQSLEHPSKTETNSTAAQLAAYFVASMMAQELQVRYKQNMLLDDILPLEYVFEVDGVPDLTEGKLEQYVASQIMCQIVPKHSAKMSQLEIKFFGVDKGQMLAKFLRKKIPLWLKFEFENLNDSIER